MYNRLFTKILDSSIWIEPSETRIVWLTLIAAMDEDGYAHFSAIENLALRARVTVEQAQTAVDCFLNPDPNSSNPENEGRRVERVPGGFFILNAPEHRKILNREIQREQVRVRVARHREKVSGNKTTVTHSLPNVTPVYVSEDVSSSDLGKGDARGKGKCTQAEAEEFCMSIGLPKTNGEFCFNKWEGNGWTNNGKAIRNWKATIRSWKLNKYLPIQSTNNQGFKRKLEAAPRGAAYEPLPRPPELTDEQIAKNKAFIAQAVGQLKKDFAA